MQKLGILAGNSFTFPVGKTTNWMRIGIAMDAATTTSDFQAEYFNSAQGSTTVNAPLDHVSDGEYWDLHELNGTTGSGVISLYSQNPANSQIDDCASLTVAHYNGSAWDDLGQTGTNGFTCANPSSTNNPGNIDASSSIGNFSPFTFASHSAGKNPLHGAGALPVELISFSAKCNSNKINLSWSTASETNNDYFEIQKKEGNSESWTVAGKIKGAGNASTIHNYEFADESGNSETYYRLKQTDFNGSFTYSNIIIASCSGVNEFLMDVYPNPASSLNDLTVELKGKTLSKALIVVRDVLGKEYYSKTVVLENGNYFFSFEHSEETPSGIYFITASSNNSFVNKKIVIK